jgi:hypothetical protein
MIQCVRAHINIYIYTFFFKQGYHTSAPKISKSVYDLERQSREDRWRHDTCTVFSSWLCLKAKKTEISWSMEKRKETRFIEYLLYAQVVHLRSLTQSFKTTFKLVLSPFYGDRNWISESFTLPSIIPEKKWMIEMRFNRSVFLPSPAVGG